MMDQRKENLPHLFPKNTSTSEPYKSHNIKIKRSPLPTRERIQHGSSLREQLKQIQPVALEAKEAQIALGIKDGIGLRIQFESFTDVKLAFESLANSRKGIELLNYKEQDDKGFATVFVPDGKLDFFENIIIEY
ncbi:hypothetical protein [Pseudomonas helleri]|nr:hypothetical protein [Pseudomonas helleri]